MFSSFVVCDGIAIMTTCLLLSSYMADYRVSSWSVLARQNRVAGTANMSFHNSDVTPEASTAAQNKELPEPPRVEGRRSAQSSGRWYYTIVALFFILTRSVDNLPAHGIFDELQNTVLDLGMLWYIYLAVKSWWMSVVSSRSLDIYILPAFGAIYLAGGILAHKMPAVFFGLLMLLKKAMDERYRSKLK